MKPGFCCLSWSPSESKGTGGVGRVSLRTLHLCHSLGEKVHVAAVVWWRGRGLAWNIMHHVVDEDEARCNRPIGRATFSTKGWKHKLSKNYFMMGHEKRFRHFLFIVPVNSDVFVEDGLLLLFIFLYLNSWHTITIMWSSENVFFMLFALLGWFVYRRRLF